MEDCGICLCELCETSQPVASLPCRHAYHESCIRLWSETSNSCPYCRAEFVKIEVRAGPDVAVRSVAIAPVVRVDEADDAFEEEAAAATTLMLPLQTPAERCIVCGGSDRPSSLMLCDSCNDGYHHTCMREPDAVSPLIGPFFCPTCVLTGQAPSVDDCVPTRVRTVETNVHLTRGHRHLPPHRAERSENWTRAWQRARSRAWSRLNATLDYGFEHAPRPSAVSQTWRNRIERGRPERASRRAIDEVPAPEDPEIERLWRAFDRASAQIRTTHSSASSRKRSRSRSQSVERGAPESSRPQKRPVRRLRQEGGSLAHASTQTPSAVLPAQAAITLQPSQATTLQPTQAATMQRISRPSDTGANELRGVLAQLRGPPSKYTIAAAVGAALRPYYRTKLDRDAFAALNRRITHDIIDGWRADTSLAARVSEEVARAVPP